MSTTDSDNTTVRKVSPDTIHTVEHDASELSEWQRFFLDRLDGLLTRQTQTSQDAEVSDEQRKLLTKAIYSTLLDCQEQGLTERALQRIASHGSQGPSAN